MQASVEILLQVLLHNLFKDSVEENPVTARIRLNGPLLLYPQDIFKEIGILVFKVFIESRG